MSRAGHMPKHLVLPGETEGSKSLSCSFEFEGRKSPKVKGPTGRCL